MGILLGFISDTHSVRNKPEVNLGVGGVNHDPLGGVNTCFGFNPAKRLSICYGKLIVITPMGL
jgi:hypothetical protein